MPFSIIHQDITKTNVDAIVNAANTDLQAGGGVCGAIFKAAGAKKLQAACNKVAPIKVGSAAITPGFDLQAKYIIHAAGPIYSHWSAGQNEIYLRSAYTESLILAKENGCESIAFPLISSGIYGYPKDEALKVATNAIRDFIAENDMNVYLTVFDRESFQVNEELHCSIKKYIDENYVDIHTNSLSIGNIKGQVRRDKEFTSYISSCDTTCETYFDNAESCLNVDDAIKELDEPLSDTLLRLIDMKGKTDAEVYKKANIDRKLFSKIRTGNGYMPSKRTIIALCIALELTLNETNNLLSKAGYVLSHSVIFDVIVKFFIENSRYDIYEINEVLFKYDQPLLGG